MKTETLGISLRWAGAVFLIFFLNTVNMQHKAGATKRGAFSLPASTCVCEAFVEGSEIPELYFQSVVILVRAQVQL